MPYQANTWSVLQTVQSMILAQVLVQDSVNPTSPGVPFQSLLAADATRFGVANAVFIGVPKDWRAGTYKRQCHIVPMPEQVAWRAFGGKVWDYTPLYIRFCYSREDDWYQTITDLVKARDVMYKVLSAHAEGYGNAEVQASMIMAAAAGGAPTGYTLDSTGGDEWDCWGFLWRVKQEYYVQGGIQP